MSAVLAQPEAMADVVDAESFRSATGASDTAMADMQAYLELLGEWNQRMNLVGPSALKEFWPRHAWDSAQLLRLAPDALRWADLGAGAGFPGVVLAILLKGRPGAHVDLIESMAKRSRFLSEVVERLKLPAAVHIGRAEDMRLKVEVVTARALAPVTRLLGYVRPHLRPGIRGLFLKGQDVEAELTEATKCWKFEAQLWPSLSRADGRILEIKGPIRAV